MERQHHYKLSVKWTGNNGTGTSSYRAYERSFSVISENKVEIFGSSDPSFRGDKSKHNPEELLVAALMSCHMLSYLHLCTEAGIMIIDYVDNATGLMVENPDGNGRFAEVTLNPIVTVAEQSMKEKAEALHKKANELCFIANSVNFPVNHHPTIKINQIQT